MIPKYNEMYEEVLAALSKSKELRLTDLVDQVSTLLNLSEDERNERLANDNCTIIYYRLGWTKTYLVKAGLVKTVRRGVYSITEEGRKLLDSGVKITNHDLMRYESFAEFVRPGKTVKKEADTAAEDTPIENIDKSIQMISSRLSDDLLEMILSKEPAFFERLVMELLNRMGYAFDDDSVIVTKYTGDEGIDGIIKEDKFGFSNIYVQAKRWNGNVGRPEIQKFLGAVAGQGGSKGLFITTSSFSKDAIDFAKKQLQVKLILVDGKMLTNLMIQYNLGVSVIKTYEIKQLDVDYFEGEMI